MINLPKVERAHRNFLRAHNQMVETELDAAGKIGADHPRQHATFKHRAHATELATDYKVVRTRGGHLVRIVNRKKVAHWLEYGTKPHRIVARRARALRFVVRGQVLFRRAVNRPGTRPYKFLYRATSAAYRVAGPNIESGMRKIARTF